MKLSSLSPAIPESLRSVLKDNFDFDREDPLTPVEMRSVLQDLGIRPRPFIQALFREGGSATSSFPSVPRPVPQDAVIDAADLQTILLHDYGIVDASLRSSLVGLILSLSLDEEWDGQSWHPVITAEHWEMFLKGGLVAARLRQDDASTEENEAYPNYTLIAATPLSFEDIAALLTDTDEQQACHPFLQSAVKLDENTVEYTDLLSMAGISFTTAYIADFYVDPLRQTVTYEVTAARGVRLEHVYSYHQGQLRDEVKIQGPFRAYTSHTAHETHPPYLVCITEGE